ncbi:hypothetical protein MW290_22020 [Aquincola tertiaricarbonis]|uniref:Uncharacterized protein n=1 Tax=Aquincola tertiaricarbonis TaxID=391953 RepID=A0ABY4SE63_AQUTE|nr:hypothetical protein [Aquincola tertiaricarbonis]URI11618.1 hypothetical protein MW290_22020 [Aquincola tertiaricarbonis]
MSDQRPIPSDGEATRERNDRLILGALETLRDPVKRAKLKLKCTVPAVCKLTELSTNTVRSRPWALETLKGMKAAAKRTALEDADQESEESGGPPVSLVEALRSRITSLLHQNTSLFDEVLVLREQLKARELVIEELQGKRLRVVLPPNK